jgi:hypothetical protein
LTINARIVATVKKVPGFAKISGYTPAAYASPAVLISNEQLKFLVDKLVAEERSFARDYAVYSARQPANNTYDISKKIVFVQVDESATQREIAQVKNKMIQLAGQSSNIFAFDRRQFEADLKANMEIIYLAAIVISVFLFILSFFQSMVSISSNIREDS